MSTGSTLKRRIVHNPSTETKPKAKGIGQLSKVGPVNQPKRTKMRWLKAPGFSHGNGLRSKPSKYPQHNATSEYPKLFWNSGKGTYYRSKVE